MYSLEPDSQCSCWCDLEMIQCQLHWRMGFHRNVLQECASSRNFNQRGDLRARRYFLLGRGTGECRCIFDAEAVLTFVSCLAKLVFQERCDISFLCFFFFFPSVSGLPGSQHSWGSHLWGSHTGLCLPCITAVPHLTLPGRVCLRIKQDFKKWNKAHYFPWHASRAGHGLCSSRLQGVVAGCGAMKGGHGGAWPRLCPLTWHRGLPGCGNAGVGAAWVQSAGAVWSTALSSDSVSCCSFTLIKKLLDCLVPECAPSVLGCSMGRLVSHHGCWVLLALSAVGEECGCCGAPWRSPAPALLAVGAVGWMHSTSLWHCATSSQPAPVPICAAFTFSPVTTGSRRSRVAQQIPWEPCCTTSGITPACKWLRPSVVFIRLLFFIPFC